MHAFPRCSDCKHIGEACECTDHEKFDFYRDTYNTYANILRGKGLQKINIRDDIRSVLPYTIFQDLDMLSKNMYVKEIAESKRLELEAYVAHYQADL